MRTVPEPPKIEPVCSSNGPKVVMSLAVPPTRPLLCQIFIRFCFRQHMSLYSRSPNLGTKAVACVLLRRTMSGSSSDERHVPKNVFDCAFKRFRQVRAKLFFDVSLGLNRPAHHGSI